ncbi:MAG TPA: cation:proton antiporter [Bacteroidales bacterium]|nr:cation:proton antiporter [Bacteroidales bacterium]HRZ49612.1 cation:proton antiporter [Bacteroidales bacterium]
MIILSVTDLTLPIASPVLRFLIILLIILFAPIILNKLKIPHLLGLIIAGAVVGPNGFNLMLRDSSIVMSGTAGLLYIMFLAGLEIDLQRFKKNSLKSLYFGMLTFLIPMGLGMLAGIYLLGFRLDTSILLASMFASHTLIAYPIISKYGLTKNRAVSIAVGGTLITDTLALLVLAVIVGMANGKVDHAFWINLSVSVLVFGLLVIVLFPVIARWFFKHFEDKVTQYIFVLVMVFLGAVLAELAGIEGIIGAFLAGLALNRLIPSTSALMSRVEFVGNAIFIPFFLIGVGMLVDYRAFFRDWNTLFVAAVMTLVAIIAKFLAAWITQKSFRMSADERKLIFGLSNAQAAATLAAVLVGYNVILGYDALGQPVRLLGDSILNGTIVMILVTCTIASFSAQRGSRRLAMKEREEEDARDEAKAPREKILVPLYYPDNVQEMVNLGVVMKSRRSRESLLGLHVIAETGKEQNAEKKASQLLEEAQKNAAATDHRMETLVRYDEHVVNGISGVVKEHKVTDIILGLHRDKGASTSFLGHLTEGILVKCNATTFVYKPVQPLTTIKRHIVVIPDNAEKEIGFPYWLMKIWNLASNAGARLSFYAPDPVIGLIRDLHKKYPVQADFIPFSDWDDFLIIARDVRPDDNLIIILSRKNHPSYRSNMANIPLYLNKYFRNNSFVLIFPMQENFSQKLSVDFKNPSLVEPIEKLDDIGKTLFRLFRKR